MTPNKRADQPLLEGLNVSRETLERLEHYQTLLEKWNRSINLVANSTLVDGWTRHFLDSAQLMTGDVLGNRWTDIGSGAGFPGLVCAILSAELAPERQFSLLESDQRKSEFLRMVSRETSVPVDVVPLRIEQAPPQNAEIISARALAPLSRLLSHVQRHGAEGSVALLLKGRTYQEEIDEALAQWRFKSQVRPSVTNSEAVVLEISEVERVI